MTVPNVKSNININTKKPYTTALRMITAFGQGIKNNPRFHQHLRVRRGPDDGNWKFFCGKKPMGLVSWWNIVVFLITSQLIAMFFFVANHPHLGGSAGDFATIIDPRRVRNAHNRMPNDRMPHPDIPPVSILFQNDNNNKEAEEFKKRLEPFEVGDERQHRVLYSSSGGGASGGDGTNEGEESEREEGQGGDEGEDQALPVSPLDNYGTRQHMNPKPNEYSGTTPAYLIVGGSDGSGTRAVVNQLVELGALFHVEDKRTMDVHGSEMFHKGGWPPLVNLIMNSTHSANYEVDDLPPAVRTKAISELTKLKNSIDKRAESKLRMQARLQKSTSHFATATHIGWKAPVSMVLLPLLRQVFGTVKFLHVVRDGRDVCLSDNQSPVKKFYNTYYEKSEKFTNDKDEATTNNITKFAMQLWNDMNQQVMDYGRTHSDGTTLDYLTIRTEDLVNPDTKFMALLQLSDFIGSKKSVAELCCLSQREVKDMGKSHKTNMEAKDQQRRGGLWGIGSKEDFLADSFMYGPSGAGAGERYAGRYREIMDRIITHPRHKVGDHGPNNGRIRATPRGHVSPSEFFKKEDDTGADSDANAHQLLIEQAKDELELKKEEYYRNKKQQRKYPILSGIQGMYARRKARAEAAAVYHANKKNNKEEGKEEKRTFKLSKPINSGGGVDQEESQHHRRRLLTFPQDVEKNRAVIEKVKAERLREGRQPGPKLRDVVGGPGGRPPPRHPGHVPPSRRGGVGMGRRDNLVREAPEQVKARYGKWVKALEDKPELSATLHQLGSTGLQSFGYEPSTTFLDPPDITFVEQCKTILEQNVCKGLQPAEQ